jgi:hypothetical protein
VTENPHRGLHQLSPVIYRSGKQVQEPCISQVAVAVVSVLMDKLELEDLGAEPMERALNQVEMRALRLQVVVVADLAMTTSTNLARRK